MLASRRRSHPISTHLTPLARGSAMCLAGVCSPSLIAHAPAALHASRTLCTMHRVSGDQRKARSPHTAPQPSNLNVPYTPRSVLARGSAMCSAEGECVYAIAFRTHPAPCCMLQPLCTHPTLSLHTASNEWRSDRGMLASQRRSHPAALQFGSPLGLW